MIREAYRAYIRSSLLAMLAYRLRYFTGILTYLLYVSIHYFIWQAVFAAQTGPDGSYAVINGYNFRDMVTYLTVAWISRSLCFSNIDYEIDDIVRSGQVSIYLLRPVSFQLMMLSQALGELVFRLLFFTLPIGLVIGALFPISPPASGAHALMFLWSTFIGFLVMAEINFAIGMIAFFFKSISSVIQAKHYLLQLLSGLLLPLSFFPAWAEAVLRALPFQLITFMPLEVYLGRVPVEGFGGVLVQQAGWVLALHALGLLLWRKATERLVIQGG